MATLARPKKRPVLPDAGSVERYAKLTREGLFKLTEAEQTWHQRYRYLQANGYLLRPRYAPGWKPSWINTNDDPLFCEDSVTLRYYQVIDATRLSDKKLVAIKSFFTDRQEMHIAQFLASVQDSRNHTVPILEILPDPTDPQRALMVMPYLRPCNDPEFSTIGDVVEFLDQTIDGLVFMHAHNIAHRDVAVANIMMDARALYPQGHHPMQIGYSPDVLHPVTPLPRAGRDVKYYYIDFGLSSRFPPGTSTLVIGDVGRAYVPELSDTVPYDAFKVDIFSLGDLFLQEFEQKYNNVEFLAALIEPMVQKQPALRPTAELVLREWTKIRATLNESRLRWRLVPKNEAPLERVVNDTVAVAWEGVYRLKKFVAP
ncbi:kinase-like domain-containing protein [Trametes polyzona]|nr:kinase-like domain-containing protein [Trametes polyzona]